MTTYPAAPGPRRRATLVTEYRCVLAKDRVLRCEDVVSRRVNDDNAAARVARASIGFSPIERMVVLGLDGQNHVLGTSVVAQGGLHSLVTTAADVLRPVLLMAASGFVLAHNHPCGNPTPSSDDYRFTARLREASLVIGLPLVDHVVITDDSHHSMLENGWGPDIA